MRTDSSARQDRVIDAADRPVHDSLSWESDQAPCPASAWKLSVPRGPKRFSNRNGNSPKAQPWGSEAARDWLLPPLEQGEFDITALGTVPGHT